MSSIVGAILTVLVLGAWHLRTRRHPCWSASADARFYIIMGYPATAIAVFWLVEATATTACEWVIGNLWALAAMVAFVYGFNALHRTHDQQQRTSRAIETISPSTPAATTESSPSFPVN